MGEIPVVRLTDGREVTFFSTDYVEARLRSAGRTLKMIPATGCWPARFRSCWPEVVRTFEDAYGWHEADEVQLRPTMRQLNELEQVLGWLPLLSRRPGKGSQHRTGRIAR